MSSSAASSHTSPRRSEKVNKQRRLSVLSFQEFHELANFTDMTCSKKNDILECTIDSEKVAVSDAKRQKKADRRQRAGWLLNTYDFIKIYFIIIFDLQQNNWHYHTDFLHLQRDKSMRSFDASSTSPRRVSSRNAPTSPVATRRFNLLEEVSWSMQDFKFDEWMNFYCLEPNLFLQRDNPTRFSDGSSSQPVRVSSSTSTMHTRSDHNEVVNKNIRNISQNNKYFLIVRAPLITQRDRRRFWRGMCSHNIYLLTHP